MRLLERLYMDNSLGDWVQAVAVAVAFMLLAWGIKIFAIRQLRALAHRTVTHLDDLLVNVLAATRLLFLFPLAIYLATLTLNVPARPEQLIQNIAIIALLLQAAFWANRFLVGWLKLQVQTRTAEDPAGVTALNILGYIARVGLWAVVLLLALDNLGFNITALLAGLGIGGVAVALAAQNVLGDLFASLSIVLDRPFAVGDFIVVGEQLGTVEYVGLKTTRIRSLSGEQIVFPNADLLNSRIHNFKRMDERRVVFSFGVVYQTSPENLERVPAMVREIVEQTPGTRFDRAHFKAFGDSSLDFEVVYYVLDRDYNIFMDTHQAILFRLNRRFHDEQIDFAYPTRTVYLQQEPSPE